MNRAQRRNKLAFKTANWIVQSILKLPDEDLLEFYRLVLNELQKRGVINV